MNSKLRTYITDALYLLAGSIVYAVSIDIFLQPNTIIPGGMTGLSLVLNHFLHIPVGTIIIMINIPLLIMMWIKIGPKALLKTIIATFVSSVFIDVGALFLPKYTENFYIAAFIGGITSGIGLGLIYMRDMTTGGSDVLGKLLVPLLPWMSYGTIVGIVDFSVVLLAMALFPDISTVIASLTVVMVCAYVVNALMSGPDRGKLIYIISDKYEEITECILKLDRGVTYVDSIGAFTGQKKKMILVAVRRHELFKIKNIVRSVDRSAFMIVGDVSEIHGEGFAQGLMNNE